eukprot:CAMPEP_0206187780 /NCGR_PEP_ID=MMETSP0166-20121206/3202_1 /ASSEMBLY_ACC=CAM_ASM_000260 /TAXON_ID=95228 /ORGANISM="Vannella robusta, Strain DIVA3 518/3/11/1/6" /LENGTH=159 /DNA_ID=CAMNT_0053603421 /DNA_START=147 /DNA_END=623 /DNA_ORIENTATION=-
MKLHFDRSSDLVIVKMPAREKKCRKKRRRTIIGGVSSLLFQLRGSKDLEISEPLSFEHLSHVSCNGKTAESFNIPREWNKIIKQQFPLNFFVPHTQASGKRWLYEKTNDITLQRKCKMQIEATEDKIFTPKPPKVLRNIKSPTIASPFVYCDVRQSKLW